MKVRKLYIKKEGSEYVVRSEKTGKSLGRYKTKDEAKKRLQQVEYWKHRSGTHHMAAPSTSPDAFQQAVEAWRNRIPVTDAELKELSDELQDYAFTVAGVTQADLVTQVFEALDSAIANGTTFEDFKDEIGDQLQQSWGEENPGQLETVFRTNVQTAYNEGRYDVLTDDDVKESHPYFRFDAIKDDRTTDTCDELDGTILPQDDPFWDSHHPPLHFNCRSILTPMSEEDANKEGVDTSGPKVEVGEGFGKSPDTEDDYSPDIDSYPPEIQEILSRRIS